jgi:hypothetical protein
LTNISLENNKTTVKFILAHCCSSKFYLHKLIISVLLVKCNAYALRREELLSTVLSFQTSLNHVTKAVTFKYLANFRSTVFLRRQSLSQSLNCHLLSIKILTWIRSAPSYPVS